MDAPSKEKKTSNWSRWCRWAACPILATELLLGVTGCTRRFFRQRADDEVGQVIKEKDQYKDWKIEDFHVYPDPRARFGDPTNPDRPPMPPDDPAADAESPHPQRPRSVERVRGVGYLDLLAKWDAESRAEAAANKNATGSKSSGYRSDQTGSPEGTPPSGTAQTPSEISPGAPAATFTTLLSRKPKPGERPPYLLKLDQAVELGLINSREYQDAREDLYLAALPVTLERFGFAAQFFAAGEALRQWAGRQEPESTRNNWTFNSNAGFSKLFSTGALLLFNFANQTVFNFTGTGRPTVSQSLIDLDFIQPFLRGGGRAVTLEPLTQAERNLLYEIRSFARFRKTFYVAIAGGGGGALTGGQFQPVGVLAANTFSPTAGLGSSGLVAGVVPGVPTSGTQGLQIVPGPSGRLLLNTAFAAPVSGYLATLLQAAQIRVDEFNISKLDGFLDLAKSFEEGGDLSQLQVDQFEQALLRGRSSLLNDQQQYLQSLDQFKLQLGLPTEMHIELDDTPFRPLNRMFERYESVFKQFSTAINEPLRVKPPAAADARKQLRRYLTTSPIVKGTTFVTTIERRWGSWENLAPDALRKRLADLGEQRRQLLNKRTELETKGETLSPADLRRLDGLTADIELGQFEDLLRKYEGQPWQNVTDPIKKRRDQQVQYRYVVSAYSKVLAEAFNERIAQLRPQWPDLARLCVSGVDLLKADLDSAEAAVAQAALTNRLDLMNVRAQAVDAWRQIAVFANALLGTFNVHYHLDSSTPPGLAQPINFSGSRLHQQLFLNWQLPLVRVSERNDYRAALINFQRTRRIVQRAEDQTVFDVRGELRQLRQQEELYRIQQRQVELGYLTVDNSLDTFAAPQPPGTATNAGTEAALTTQLINAQNTLYNAQFAMTTIWITYLNTRLQLYRDMELMPLDNRGVWIDEVATCECPPGPTPKPARLGSPELVDE